MLSPEGASALLNGLVDRIVAKVAEANAREIEEAGRDNSDA